MEQERIGDYEAATKLMNERDRLLKENSEVKKRCKKLEGLVEFIQETIAQWRKEPAKKEG